MLNKYKNNNNNDYWNLVLERKLKKLKNDKYLIVRLEELIFI